MSIEASLSALLQAEVEKRVKSIEDAAGEAVAAFRRLAESLAQGQPYGAPQAPTEPVSVHVLGATQKVPFEAPDETPEHMRVAGFSNYVTTDSAAAAANMKV